MSADWWGAENVSVRYGRRLALDEVSFHAADGRVAAVVGGDGAGKTTLLRCLAGALAPASGRVRRPDKFRIGYLAPGSGTYPDLSVDENLAFRAAAYRMSATDAHRQAAAYLERAGLAHSRGQLAGRLSGGMRQKLGVIAAMLHRPDLLILDEPTTGIDPVSRADLWWLIAAAAAAGAAVMVSTAYLDEAERASSVLVLDAGRVLAAGTPAEIIAGMPGVIRPAAAAPAGEERRRAWRRGAGWRVWDEEGDAQGDTARAGGARAEAVQPDLQDAVTVAALARELAAPPASAPSDGAAVPRRGDDAAVPPSGAAGLPAAPGRPAVTGALAQCTGVTRRFGQLLAVDRVDLQVGAGEVVGLLGANGAGKTTLIRMLLGLLRPTEGEVLLSGEPPSRRVRRRIGYVPQGLGLYDDLTPAENMGFAQAAFGMRPGAIPADLRSFSDTVVGQLPLGVQRRVAFAQALAHEPGLLVLDEPTSGVDPLARARLWQTIREAADAGAGVLVTTHYMDEAAECDRLVVMAGGRVVAAGTPSSIVGAARVTVVESSSWAGAYSAIEAAGLHPALAGASLRVPGAPPGEVSAALGRAGLAGVSAVAEVPATLDERFAELTAPSLRARPAGGDPRGGAENPVGNGGAGRGATG